jgi:anaerobic selenocysteine-containing dehydrogenase
MCGLRIQVEDGRVTRIRPNQEDVWSRGYICPKGTTLGELHRPARWWTSRPGMPS